MRFILSFIFFGLLFYAMSIYLPEAFQTLVSWAASLFDFLRDLVEKATDKVQSAHPTAVPSQPQ